MDKSLSQLPDRSGRFLPLLAEFEMDQLESDGNAIYGLWPDLTLAYVNPAWNRFAAENGGEPAISTQWTLGRCVLEAVTEPLRRYFASNYSRCLRELRPWEHAYECSSADEFREFHMTVFPLGRAEGLLVVNSLRIESAHHRTASPAKEEHYRNKQGIISQCCHCRRIKRIGNPPGWDWVPSWVKRTPERTSHVLCPTCWGFYYSDARRDLEKLVVPFSTI